MAKNIRREHGGDPVSGQGHRLRANDTSVHHQRVDGSADAGQAGADRIQIGDIHDNHVEDAPAGRGFELGLCRSRPISVPARQVDPGHLRTKSKLPGHILADPDVGARDQHGLFCGGLHLSAWLLW